MKLAIPFKLNNEKNDTAANEFNIKFTKKNSVEKLIVFLKKYPYHRVNIEFEGKFDKGVLYAASAVHSNIAVRLKSIDAHNQKELLELKNQKIKFFFDLYEMAAYNRSTLEKLLNFGVSDVYILDDLCYSLEDVKKRCEEENVQIRMVLNRIASTNLDKNKDATAPFFVPQLFHILSKWVDVAEFDCGKPYNWHEHEVLYRTWFEKQYWAGPLSNINKDIQFDYPGGSILPQLLTYKLNCNKKCVLQSKKRRCSKCSMALSIASNLRDKSIIIKAQ